MSPPLARSVLYAEDDENDVFFMERAFSKLKLRSVLQVVADGRAAVDYLSGLGSFGDRIKHPLPDLLLLDVKMPQMSGLEVLKWARARSEFECLPILMFTSSTQRTDMEFSRDHHASGYLVKPSNSEDLATLVNKILVACAAHSPAAGYLDLEENQLRAA